jgi:DNA polymerase (family 10)
MQNSQIAENFELIGDLLEITGANFFRVRAYRNAARTIRDLDRSLATIASANKDDLQKIDGIGKDLAEKISSLLDTGEIPMLEELRAQVPESVLALMRIPGLGPKKAAVLHKELSINTLEQLRAACEAGAVKALKGFGAKTEQAILAGLAIAETAQLRMPWAKADEIAAAIREHMQKLDEIEELEFAGSYRRGKETVGDLDLLVVAASSQKVMEHFGKLPFIGSVIVQGDTKMSIRTDTGMQVDLRVVDRPAFGAALQYFTGSKDHNVVLRGMAKDRGLKINEYGVFRVSKKGEEEYLCGATEKEVYDAMDLPLFPPEIREARQEFEAAKSGKLPKLIEQKDICGDLHMHTTATDGAASIVEMVEAAIARGYSYVAITDHSQRVTVARGLDPARLLAQWKEIDELNKRYEGKFAILKGIECDILEKAVMDLPDEVLAQADWVLASLHFGQRQPREQIMERMLMAARHPSVSAIAHPTGRLIGHRPPYDLDLELLMDVIAEEGKMLELNASPERLDLDDVQCAAAKRRGIPIVINTDAHSVAGLAAMRYGILQARRGALTAKDVANARPLPEMRKLLKRAK